MDSIDRLTATGTGMPERVARVRAIFEAALARPERDRRLFLEGACLGDLVLQREVEALLAADATGEPLLDAAAGPVRLRATPPGVTAGQGGPALHATPGSSPEEGRFPAGTVLAGRYRILGMLGRGGMGEVYRAHDLILNQTVALKFLNPGHLSEAALARFRNEVRIARQVSHPNVCRVYDLGMVEGLHFLSMEYIDGEDLASLLRRIGRLPQDKAIEFTRKICAGLSAAHERGVLHRDLKPANIMIDGRGQPRITDFGLAGLAAEIPLSDLRSGTPAYMSPEQKAGKDVTTRSDIYSLGLVLYEMFTGKRRADTQSHPSDLVKDLDQTIERVILRCLEEDLKRRPGSALNVAMALPGADPIAAALAAGETPSPEMVAASQEQESFSVRTAVLLFVAVVLSVPAAPFGNNSRLLRQAHLDKTPEELAIRAEDMLGRFGYDSRPVSRAHGFRCCNQETLKLVNGSDRASREAILQANQPPLAAFWYRRHSDLLYAEPFITNQVTYTAPANSEPGMVRMILDPAARLLALEGRPAEQASTRQALDWPLVLKEAGFTASTLAPTRPSSRIPPVPFDTRAAWTSTYATSSKPVHIEAAALEGRLVFFAVDDPEAAFQNEPLPFLVPVLIFLLAFVAVGAPLLARHNLRSGRGDRKGATFLVGIFSVSSAATLLLHQTHVRSPWEVALLWAGAGDIALRALLLWCGYIAIEPYARRYWPESLISLSRLQAGRLRDPLVMSHLLAGLATWQILMTVTAPAWALSPLHGPENIDVISGHPRFIAALVSVPAWSVSLTAAFLLLIVVLRLIARRRLWPADSVACLLLALTGPLDGTSLQAFALTLCIVLGSTAVLMWLVRRFGFVTLMGAAIARYLMLPTVFGTWYTSYGLIANGLLVAIAAWALWVIVSDTRQSSTESAA